MLVSPWSTHGWDMMIGLGTKQDNTKDIQLLLQKLECYDKVHYFLQCTDKHNTFIIFIFIRHKMNGKHRVRRIWKACGTAQFVVSTPNCCVFYISPLFTLSVTFVQNSPVLTQLHTRPQSSSSLFHTAIGLPSQLRGYLYQVRKVAFLQDYRFYE